MGLGSQLTGIDATPTGLDNCSVLPAIAQGLAQRGFSSELIDKVMGQNFLRIAQRVLG